MMRTKRVPRSVVHDNHEDLNAANDEFEDLRATLAYMLADQERFALAKLLIRLMDSGHIVAIIEDNKPTVYMIDGASTAAQIAPFHHLITTIDNRIHQSLIELAVKKFLYFLPCDDHENLAWAAFKPPAASQPYPYGDDSCNKLM